MTSLSDLQKHGGGGDKLPAFAFKRIGDKVRGTILRSDTVEVNTPNGTRLQPNRPRTKLVIDVEVEHAKGGRAVMDPDNPELLIGVEDFAQGEHVAVWLPAGFGIGAVADAVKAAGESQLADGGTITIELSARKDTGKAKPANVYAAEYVPPVNGTSMDDF